MIAKKIENGYIGEEDLKNIKTSVYDPAKYLQDEEEMAIYLQEAIDTNNPSLLVMAIGVAARARSMNKIAKDIGVARESLYRSLDGNTKVSFETVYKVLECLGFRIDIKKEKINKKVKEYA